MKTFICGIFAFCGFQAAAQTNLTLFNPSFEESPAQHSTEPEGWISCGFPNYSPPDVHGMNTQFYQVTEDPMFGEQYVGLIARPDHTWEDLGQNLVFPLEKDRWHFMSFYARKAENYITSTRADNSKVNHSNPVVIIFYGSNEPCKQTEILAVTPVLDYEQWTKVPILFKPKETYSYLWFEVNYEFPDEEPYAGNVLIDNFSPIQIWSDTVRYFPLVAGTDFLDWIDTETIQTTEIRQKAKAYTAAALASESFDVFAQADLYYLNLAEDFAGKVKAGGIRQLLMNGNANELIYYIRALKLIKADQEAKLLEEGYLLIQKSRDGSINPTEAERFDKLPQLFQEKADLDAKIQSFVEANSSIILNQLRF